MMDRTDLLLSLLWLSMAVLGFAVGWSLMEWARRRLFKRAERKRLDWRGEYGTKGER